MESKVLTAIRRYDMVRPGDRVICAVSGGPDSMALLWCLWMLKDKLGITLEAAHFNHHLRAAESDRDENHVRAFCDLRDIPLHVGGGTVQAGAKGLEAAAREARYTYLKSLGGIVATAHTADDNAETLLMHLLRGSGLRGLGGITPVSEGLIRPMLDVTRQEVEDYVSENWLPCVTDSSNHTDQFLRNRLRHGVIPLLKEENPRLAVSMSAAAQRLRQDEELLQSLASGLDGSDVTALRKAHPALRRRALERFLRENGVPEPSAAHIVQAESLVLSGNPSARTPFGSLTLTRQYDRLVMRPTEAAALAPAELPERGELLLEDIGIRVITEPCQGPEWGEYSFSVCPKGPMLLRSRQAGDELTLKNGTKTLKKRFIDRKIPQHLRAGIPVIGDAEGILGVMGFGPDEKRRTGEHWVRVTFVPISPRAEK